MSRIVLVAGIVAGLHLGALQVDAQPVGGFVANLPTPASPAFAALNVSPSKIIHPATPNELGSSIANGVDRTGALETGIAIDFAPYMTWAGKHVTRNDYRDHSVQRFLSRVQTSFATVKAADSGAKAARAALGVSMTLFDFGDPRADEPLAKCLAASARAALASAPPVVPPPLDLEKDQEGLKKFKMAIDKIEASRQKAFANTCRDDARPQLWNRSAMTVGVAPTWISTAGDLQHLTGDGTAVWASLAYGFEGLGWWQSSSQLVGFMEHRTDAAASSAQKASTPSTSIGARWRVGTGEALLSLDVLHLARSGSTGDSDGWSIGVSGQRKVAGNWWITLAVGGETNSKDGAAQTFVLNTLSWSYAER